MLTTEDEAKTKRCFQSFPSCGGITPEGYSVAAASPYGHTYTGGGGYAVTTAPSMCIGSACMAWRWRGWANYPDAANHHLTHSNPTADHPDFKRYGFCGLAGACRT